MVVYNPNLPRFNFMEKIQVGVYWTPLPIYSATASTPDADKLWLIPFPVIRNLTIDRLAIDVTVAAAGKIARLGIYEDGTDLYPGALVLDAGTVSVAAVGVVAATVNQSLTKGLYWLAFVSDGNPTVAFHLLTWSPLGHISGAFDGVGRMNSGYSKAAVGSAALADPCVSGAAVRNYSSNVCVLPRLKSLD